MLKANLAITKKEIALPLEVIYDFKKSHWVIAVRLLCFLFQVVHIREPKKELIEVPPESVPAEPETVKATKAYADQRQKAKRNRRRKPSKAMANLYRLEV